VAPETPASGGGPPVINLGETFQQPVARWGPRIALSIVVGALAGLAAAGLDWAIHAGSHAIIGRFAQFDTRDPHFEWALVAVPAVGGLMAGLLVHLLARESMGHGVDILTRAFHRHLGRLPLRGPGVKAGGTVIVIASGGSAGPEGPIAALGAALGSFIGRLVPLPPRERRVLLIAGCAAGIGAMFRCPLGGALFATSILYSDPEFESDGIVPSLVASVIGYSIYMVTRGFQGPMLQGVESMQFASPADLPWYAVLGVVCGVVAIFFYHCMRAVEHTVQRFDRVPPWMWTALGGLGTGLIACLLPQVMDAQFVFVQDALDGRLFTSEGSHGQWAAWSLLFILVALAKCVATAFTVGSGAPGGVLGPSVFIGGSLGACLGALGHAVLLDSFSEDLRQALIPVGMAGVLAATMRVPLAATVMTMEMTGGFGLIAPLMLVCAISYLIGRRWGLNVEQVRSAADSPTHAADPVIHLLESWRVGDLMRRDWPTTVSPGTSVDEIIAGLEPGSRPVFAVAEGRQLLGVISAADIGNVMQEAGVARALIADDIMTTTLVTLREDEDLYSALATFTRVDHDVLPVLSRDKERRWMGMLVRRDVVNSLHERLQQTHLGVLEEHSSLAAIEDDVRLTQLIMGVSSQHADVQRLFVPIDAIGKSLRECDFRKTYNAQVVAVEQRDGTLTCPPDVDAPLTTDQRLLAVVWARQPEAS